MKSSKCNVARPYPELLLDVKKPSLFYAWILSQNLLSELLAFPL